MYGLFYEGFNCTIPCGFTLCYPTMCYLYSGLTNTPLDNEDIRTVGDLEKHGQRSG